MCTPWRRGACMEMVGLTTITMENSSVQVQEQTKHKRNSHTTFLPFTPILHTFLF